jgi:N-acetylneuraminate synthase
VSDRLQPQISIASHTVGQGSPCFIIAEIGQAHDGSLGTAHAYIDAVAEAGAGAIKFQTHIADAESTPDEKFRVKCFPQDATRFDYWKRMEFTPAQWKELSDHSTEKGLMFLSSPFSMEAVTLLEELEMPAWKIGSGELANHPLLERIVQNGKPILLSTGMSSWTEIDDAVSVVQGTDSDLAIFQCTTSYPCPPDKTGLNLLSELRDRYSCPVGLSDHSGTIFPGLAAVSLGADLIEVHAVFSRECFGPDVTSSVTMKELTQLVVGVRFIEAILNSPVDKDEQAAEMEDLSKIFGKSLYTRSQLPKGHLLSMQDLSFKKPGTGIPAKRVGEILGKKLLREYKTNEQLREVDLS